MAMYLYQIYSLPLAVEMKLVIPIKYDNRTHTNEETKEIARLMLREFMTKPTFSTSLVSARTHYKLSLVKNFLGKLYVIALNIRARWDFKKFERAILFCVCVFPRDRMPGLGPFLPTFGLSFGLFSNSMRLRAAIDWKRKRLKKKEKSLRIIWWAVFFTCLLYCN